MSAIEDLEWLADHRQWADRRALPTSARNKVLPACQTFTCPLIIHPVCSSSWNFGEWWLKRYASVLCSRLKYWMVQYCSNAPFLTSYFHSVYFLQVPNLAQSLWNLTWQSRYISPTYLQSFVARGQRTEWENAQCSKWLHCLKCRTCLCY